MMDKETVDRIQNDADYQEVRYEKDIAYVTAFVKNNS